MPVTGIDFAKLPPDDRFRTEDVEDEPVGE